MIKVGSTHTLNRVHSNLLHAGQRDWSRQRADVRRFPRTRTVTELDQNVRINLWELALRVAAGKPLSLAE